MMKIGESFGQILVRFILLRSATRLFDCMHIKISHNNTFSVTIVNLLALAFFLLNEKLLCNHSDQSLIKQERAFYKQKTINSIV